MKNLLHEFWNHKSDNCPLEAREQEDEAKEKLYDFVTKAYPDITIPPIAWRGERKEKT